MQMLVDIDEKDLDNGDNPFELLMNVLDHFQIPSKIVVVKEETVDEPN